MHNSYAKCILKFLNKKKACKPVKQKKKTKPLNRCLTTETIQTATKHKKGYRVNRAMQVETSRYNHKATRMGKLRHADNVICWQGCARCLVHCWRENVLTHCFGELAVFTDTEHGHVLSSSNSTFRWDTCGVAPKDKPQNVHRNVICNTTQLEAIQVSFNNMNDCFNCSIFIQWHIMSLWEWTTTTISIIWMNFISIILSDIGQTQGHLKFKINQSW